MNSLHRNVTRHRSASKNERAPAGRRYDAEPVASCRGHVGFVLAESSDAVAIGKWRQSWTDLLSFDITPVLTDEEIAEVIGWEYLPAGVSAKGPAG